MWQVTESIATFTFNQFSFCLSGILYEFGKKICKWLIQLIHINWLGFSLFLSRDAKLIKIIDFRFPLFIITKNISMVSVELITTYIQNCFLKAEIISNNNNIIANAIQNWNFLKFYVTMSCDYYVNYIDSGILQRM